MTVALRIGLWLNHDAASLYDLALADWAHQRPTVELFVFQAFGERTQSVAHRSMLLRLVTAMETAQLGRNARYRAHLTTFALASVKPDAQDIRDLDLDLVVCTGTQLPPGDVVAATRWGALAFGWADPTTRVGLPVGFWEVFERRDTTGFSIVHHEPGSSRGEALVRGRVPTRHYHLLNQAALCEKANHHLRALLDRIAATGALPAALQSMPSDTSAKAGPGFWQTAAYLKRSVAAMIGKKLNKMRGLEERWHVAFVRSDWRRAALSAGHRIDNPPGRYLADPFVIRREGRDYCFVEDFDCATQRGAISAYELNVDKAERLGVVIDEPFHMSFPYLFEFDGALFMCPETSEQREIRVYRCTEFPRKWQFEKVLMSGLSAVDTMLFERDGRWWMLTNIDPAQTGEICSELFVFSADSPLSTSWTPHAENPVLFDAGHARNGGLLTDGVTLFRVSQRQGFDRYGKGSQINQIVQLNDNHYEERCVALIEPSFRPGLLGTHHLHSRDGVTVFDSLAKGTVRTAPTTRP